jgi:hypothetical protein
MMRNRWSIWIDVEGFSNLYRKKSSQAILHLNELMASLYRIGVHVFSESPDRLFIHQFGDGFIVVSDFPEKEPTRPIAIMRHLLKKGVTTKAAIAAGDWGDISSCYPDEVIKVAQDRRFLRIGQGIMTIIPVMGMALIAAHKLSETDSGSLLLLDTSFFSGIPNEIIYKSGTASTIDWIHTELPDVKSDGDTPRILVRSHPPPSVKANTVSSSSFLWPPPAVPRKNSVHAEIIDIFRFRCQLGSPLWEPC